MPTQYSIPSDLPDRLKDMIKNYGLYALAGSALAGAAGLGFAYGNKPIDESPKQRRKRLIKSFIYPALTTAAGLSGIGLGKAIWDANNINSKALTDKASEVEEAYKDFKEVNSSLLANKARNAYQSLSKTIGETFVEHPGASGGAAYGVYRGLKNSNPKDFIESASKGIPNMGKSVKGVMQEIKAQPNLIKKAPKLIKIVKNPLKEGTKSIVKPFIKWLLSLGTKAAIGAGVGQLSEDTLRNSYNYMTTND